MKSDAYRTGREALLRILIDRLKRRGFVDIRASVLEEYQENRPPVIFWENSDQAFTPEATARKNDIDFLFAVETADSLRTQEAAERIALFAAYAGTYHRHFCLVVPEPALPEALALVRESGMDERYVHVAGA